MKIGVVGRGFWRDWERMTDGGPDWQLIQAYAQAGHTVRVLTQHEERGGGWIEREVDGIQVVAHPRWKRPWETAVVDKLIKPIVGHRKLVADALAVRRFIREYGPFDVVDARNEEADGVPVALASELGKMPPWAVQIFGLPYSFRGEEVRWERLRLYRWMFSRAPLIRANSRLVAEIIGKHYAARREKVMVVPHNLSRMWEQGLKQGEVKGEDRDAERESIVCLGALNAKKGADLFIEAVGRVLAELSEGERRAGSFVLIGGVTAKDGFAERWMERAKALFPYLRMTGKITAAEVAEELGRARAVVIPSRFDEFNRAAVEAILRAPRVMISRGCGVVDHLPADEGIEFFEPSVESLVRVLRRASAQGGGARIEQKTREEVLRRFATKTIAEENLSALMKLGKRKR